MTTGSWQVGLVIVVLAIALTVCGAWLCLATRTRWPLLGTAVVVALLGWFMYAHLYQPVADYKAECRAQGGTPVQTGGNDWTCLDSPEIDVP